MEKIILFILVVILCVLVILSVVPIPKWTRQNEQNQFEEFEKITVKTSVKIDGKIIKTEKVEKGVREVTVKVNEDENTIVIKFVVYEEDKFTGKAGEHFSGKIFSEDIVLSEIVETEIKKEQN